MFLRLRLSVPGQRMARMPGQQPVGDGTKHKHLFDPANFHEVALGLWDRRPRLGIDVNGVPDQPPFEACFQSMTNSWPSTS